MGDKNRCSFLFLKNTIYVGEKCLLGVSVQGGCLDSVLERDLSEDQ